MHVYDPAHGKVYVHPTGRSDGSVREPAVRSATTGPTRTPPAPGGSDLGIARAQGSREVAGG